MNVYEYLHLHISGDKFYFEGRQPDGSQLENGPETCLVIDRASGEMSLDAQSIVPQHVEVKKIVGIYGIINLVTGPHIIIITRRQLVGTINGEKIFRVTGTEIIPYAMSVNHITDEKLKENQVYLSMVQTVLNFESYYISYSYDLTHTLQRLQRTDEKFLVKPLHKRADKRFVWNAFMVKTLAEFDKAHRFVLPVMLGFVGICSCKVAGSKFQLIVISRRSRFNAGVRLQTRGLDNEGNAANFVETEQIIEFGDAMTSLVEIRGSIPTYWTQYANFQWLPQPKIRTDFNGAAGFRIHIKNQLSLYRRLYFINLVDHSGKEKQMYETLEYLCENEIEPNQDVSLVSFDFHHECRSMVLTRLHQLINALEEQINGFGYFVGRRIENEIRQVKRQSGMFRISCMDCLDRTNVVQGLIAKRSLEYQLKFLQILSDVDSIENYQEFDSIYRNLWADNGDALSMQYAGTGALKTDITRTGRRTYTGMLSDLKNSCTRWMLNNFYDGFRQDAINLCLGYCAVDKENPIKYDLRKWQLRHYLYIGLLTTAILLFLCAVKEDWFGLYFGTFFVAVFFMLLGYLFLNGESLVDRPRLKRLEFF